MVALEVEEAATGNTGPRPFYMINLLNALENDFNRQYTLFTFT